MAADPNPVSFKCSCQCSIDDEPGTVLLFYRYFAAPPSLPTATTTTTTITPASLTDLQSFHQSHVTSLSLGCKIRLSTEGFNITVGGTAAAIKSYVAACLPHWSFAGLPLSTPDDIDSFFKPSPGCACVFAGRQDVLIKTEITPLGVTGWLPRDWSSVTDLSPREWHRRIATEDVVVLDVRNHYESRLGHFVGQSGPAILPAVRRFGQWPTYVKKMLAEGGVGDGAKGRRDVLTYCTGGIRCEKGARWLAEEIERSGTAADTEVYTLRGGIAAYLAWADAEIAAGRMRPSDSLFKGRNFVFDARGSLGLEAGGEKVATCHGCGKAEDRIGKCASPGCFLVLVICKECQERDVRCCEDCRATADLQKQSGEGGPRRICECERAREELLRGPEKERMPKGQGWRATERKELAELGKTDELDISVKIIEKSSASLAKTS